MSVLQQQVVSPSREVCSADVLCKVFLLHMHKSRSPSSLICMQPGVGHLTLLSNSLIVSKYTKVAVVNMNTSKVVKQCVIYT